MKARFVLITPTVFISILAGSFHSSLAVGEIGDKKTTDLLTVTSASPFGGAAEYDSGWIEIAQYDENPGAQPWRKSR